MGTHRMWSPTWLQTVRAVLEFSFALVVVGALAWCIPLKAWVAILATSLVPPLLLTFPGVWWPRSTPLPRAKEDLPSRVPVWTVLSDLYAGLALDEGDDARIAEVLARSPYGMPQLEEILYREVHPVLVRGALVDLLDPLFLLDELGSFDPEWLTERISSRECHHRRITLIPAMWLKRRTWRRIRAMVVTLREGTTVCSLGPCPSCPTSTPTVTRCGRAS